LINLSNELVRSPLESTELQTDQEYFAIGPPSDVREAVNKR